MVLAMYACFILKKKRECRMKDSKIVLRYQAIDCHTLVSQVVQTCGSNIG